MNQSFIGKKYWLAVEHQLSSYLKALK